MMGATAGASCHLNRAGVFHGNGMLIILLGTTDVGYHSLLQMWVRQWETASPAESKCNGSSQM